MRFKYAVLMLPGFVLATPAITQAAAEPRYTYAELGYVNVDYDDFDVDGDGWFVGGSFAVHPNVHLLADYLDVDLDGDADAEQISLGAGVNFPMRPGLDFLARLRWIDQEINAGQFGSDEDGYGLEAGVRTMISQQLELNGGIKYVDIEDDDTSFYLGGLYDVVPNLALGGDIEISDDATVFTLKGRWYFGARR